MANNDILSEFSPSDINAFKKDFTQMIKVGAEIDRHYGEAQHDLDVLIPKFEALTEKFNKKYKGVRIKAKKTIDSFKVKIFLKVKDVKEFFAESASKIPGLKSVGRTTFNQIDISDAGKFASFLDSVLDKIFVSYADPEAGTSSIAAALDRNEKMIEFNSSPAEIMSENSAGFRICAFYALKNGYDKKIEIYSGASTFGFSSLLDEIEKREWYDKFNPRFLE
ncbi:hypothetical protein HYY71_04985 [Candidatus Woesearchaeota archaeon]|nr:hypothetical protein [Candidatus Woesearchaeota archaeon]